MTPTAGPAPGIKWIGSMSSGNEFHKSIPPHEYKSVHDTASQSGVVGLDSTLRLLSSAPHVESPEKMVIGSIRFRDEQVLIIATNHGAVLILKPTDVKRLMRHFEVFLGDAPL